MKPGPRPNAPNTRAEKSFAQKAHEAYHEAYADLPDWIVELAAVTDREGLKGAAKRIGYSVSAVSNVLNGKYSGGDIARVEQMVRGALMSLTVECPVIGEIGRDRCLQEQAEPFRATSAFRAQLFHACRSGCPNARRKSNGAE